VTLPIKNDMMYLTTGNDDAFALNAKTGEILWHWYTLPAPGG